jgi:two-component system response regulator
MVLLVEDNRADVLVVRESVALHKLPVDLHVVSDGEQAFDFIKRAEIEPEAPRPHLLLVDLNLPKRSGREILQRVRESSALKDVPVMIVTSSSSARDRKELLRLGANDYFCKPANYDDFLRIGAAMKALLDRSNPPE